MKPLALHLIAAVIASTALAMLPPAAKASGPGVFLHWEDSRTLTEIASRAQSMMTIAPFTRTAVWHPAARDARGETAMFVSSLKPLFHSEDRSIREQHETWLLISLVAVIKYAENRESLIDYIGFTDAEGQSGETTGQRWYYRINIEDAKKLQRSLITGRIKPWEALQYLQQTWKKVTPHSDLAAN